MSPGRHRTRPTLSLKDVIPLTPSPRHCLPRLMHLPHRHANTLSSVLFTANSQCGRRVRAATAGCHRLGGLKTRDILFITVWMLRSPRSRCRQLAGLVRAFSWFPDGRPCLCTLLAGRPKGAVGGLFPKGTNAAQGAPPW